MRGSLQDQLIALQNELQKTIVLVTHDVEEAIKVGDLVALYRPHGTIAQFAPPERLLGSPVDDYVAGFVGFDRGIRRLSFFRSAGLSLSTAPILGAGATVAKARATGEPWILVVDDGQARGWIPSARLGAYDGDTPLRQVPADGVGHTFVVGPDSLRAALDAAVLSPAGEAVGVDADGQVVGVATFDQLRVAIQAAEAADAADAADGPDGAEADAAYETGHETGHEAGHEAAGAQP